MITLWDIRPPLKGEIKMLERAGEDIHKLKSNMPMLQH
jgi:hypothetical protein